jgi:hypothetical protein
VEARNNMEPLTPEQLAEQKRIKEMAEALYIVFKRLAGEGFDTLKQSFWKAAKSFSLKAFVYALRIVFWGLVVMLFHIIMKPEYYKPLAEFLVNGQKMAQ